VVELGSIIENTLLEGFSTAARNARSEPSRDQLGEPTVAHLSRSEQSNTRNTWFGLRGETWRRPWPPAHDPAKTISRPSGAQVGSWPSYTPDTLTRAPPAAGITSTSPSVDAASARESGET